VIAVDDHPDWQKHQLQRNDLATKLRTAEEDLRRLQHERSQAEHDVREADVLRLLGDNVATMAPEAVAIDTAIAAAQTRVATLAQALKRLDARGDELRNKIIWELTPIVEAAARERVKKLGAALRDAGAITDELMALGYFENFSHVGVPYRWHELSLKDEYSRLRQWLSATQASGWDV
jgi:chromosome segregation ATPase